MNRRLSQCYNTAAFTPNATLTFGNAGRNIAVGPGFRNFDFSVMKNTRIGEQTNLQFRAEFFNIANHPNFALPEPTFLAAPNFGTLFQTLDTVQTMWASGPAVRA